MCLRVRVCVHRYIALEFAGIFKGLGAKVNTHTHTHTHTHTMRIVTPTHVP